MKRSAMMAYMEKERSMRKKQVCSLSLDATVWDYLGWLGNRNRERGNWGRSSVANAIITREMEQDADYEAAVLESGAAPRSAGVSLPEA